MIDLENKKHVEAIAQQFVEENQELLEMLTQRLVEYAQEGNSLAINWMSQSLIELLKQANQNCKIRLGIDESKIQ